MQWTSRQDQQLADLVNRAHLQQRIADYRPQYNEDLRRSVQAPQYYSQPVRLPSYAPSEHWEPIRPRDVLLYGTWIAAVLGFIIGAIFALT